MVFISLVGTSASGKTTVCEYLVRKHGFKRVKIDRDQRDEVVNGLGDRQHVVAKSNAHEPDPLTIPLANISLAPSPTDIASHLTFPDPATLLNHATKSWQDNYITIDLRTAEELEPFVKRPFFLVVGVDGPIGRRFERMKRRLQTRGQDLSLQLFIDQHDFDMNAASSSTFNPPSGPSVNPRPLDHNPSPTSSSFPFNHARSSPSTSTTSRGQRALLSPNGLDPNSRRNGLSTHGVVPTSTASGSKEAGSVRKAMAYAQVMVLNNFDTKEELWRHLDELDLLNGERLRPGWDTYFMTLASLASLRSNCMKRRVGALLVRSKRILSTGYNGTPRGLTNCNEGGCARCNGAANGGQGLAECLCLHAEENALLEVGRERIGEDSILYCNTCPCLTCSVKIVQTGVKEVVYNLNYSMDEASARVLKEGGVILRQLVMPSATT